MKKAIQEVTELQMKVTDLLDLQTDYGIDIARLTRAKLKCNPEDVKYFEESIQHLKNACNEVTDQISTTMKEIASIIKKETGEK